MAREKKPVHRVQMTEGKRDIIRQLLNEYDIQSAEDIQDALKDLLGSTIKEMMETEMGDHLGYQKSERSESDDYRNGYKDKQINSSYCPMKIKVPQDRQSTFEPQIEEWQNRPLSKIYPVLFIDAIHYSVRDNGIIRKLAAYIILGINLEGRKEVLTIQVGENESSKYWLSVLNDLKNCGVKDILVICADGLIGMKEAIAAAYPNTEYQRCIVHQVLNTLKYVADKDRKPFAADLKTIIMHQMSRKPQKPGIR